MDLKNKIVVITGATKGLGKALAETFSEQNAKLIINARSKKELQKVGKEIGALTYAADITRESDMKRLADYAIKKYKKIDIWINNAGSYLPQSEIEEIDSKQAHEVMEANFFGTFYGSRAALRIMKRQKHGMIINIGSASALVGRPRSALYASTKWAVRGFTESLRIALRPFGISALAVHPEGFKSTIFGPTKPAGYDEWMEPSYIAKKIIQNIKKEKPKTELVIKKR